MLLYVLKLCMANEKTLIQGAKLFIKKYNNNNILYKKLIVLLVKFPHTMNTLTRE